MDFNSSQNILYLKSGKVSLSQCGFQRNSVYMGEGGAICICCLSFDFNISQTWFYSCFSSGNGGCIFMQVMTNMGRFKITSCCASNSYCIDRKKGNFAHFYVPSSTKHSTYELSSVFNCSFDKSPLSSVITFQCCNLDINGNNVSLSTVLDGSVVELRDLQIVLFEKNIFDTNAVSDTSVIDIAECTELQSKFLLFVNNSELNASKIGCLFSLYYVHVIIDEAVFVNKFKKIATLTQSNLVISNSFISNLDHSRSNISFINLSNSMLFLNISDPLVSTYCKYGNYTNNTTSNSPHEPYNIIHIAVLILLLVIVFIAIISTLYERLNSINDEILLSRAINLEFG